MEMVLDVTWDVTGDAVRDVMGRGGRRGREVTGRGGSVTGTW